MTDVHPQPKVTDVKTTDVHPQPKVTDVKTTDVHPKATDPQPKATDVHPKVTDPLKQPDPKPDPIKQDPGPEGGGSTQGS
jgi:hypothetical protein